MPGRCDPCPGNMRTSTSHVCYALEQCHCAGVRRWPGVRQHGVEAGRRAALRGVRPRAVLRRRCDYCAFATWTDRDHLWERYVAACRAEVAGLACRSALRTRLVRPAARPPRRCSSAEARRRSCPPSSWPASSKPSGKASGSLDGAEVTVECNPETVSPAKLPQYRAGGVTRLSFGAQSMVPHVLASLGRQHDPASVERAADLAGEAGFAGAYNLDLIFGAAGETMADWQASLDAVLAFDPRPAHVSAYALTVEPGTPLATPARAPPY